MQLYFYYYQLSWSFLHTTFNLSESILTIQMQQHSNKQDKCQQKSKSLEPRIGTSTYVVNNSLVSCLRPKRASFDIKLYLQLHKKLMRKAAIEKKFEESVYQFSIPNENHRKGFQGKKKPDSFISRNHSLREKQRRAYTEQSVQLQQTSDNWEKSSWNRVRRQQQVLENHSMNSRAKPNMMYNLSLYRKGFKHSSFKREKMCMTIMQSMQRTKRQSTIQKRQRSSKRSKLRTTIY